MKVYALVGKSGTGKSYQALNLCKERGIESIIDDGLFIYKNKVLAGESAKRQPTKVGAVKTALFSKQEHRDEVAKTIQEKNLKNILVIGTSDEMVRRIVKRLDIPEISETIYITEITTEEEREIANVQRHELGKHVIPVPTFQLKRQFSGYFVDPMRVFRGFGHKGSADEKSVVRPTYSYMGEYKISDKVFTDIAECVTRETEAVDSLIRLTVETAPDGINVTLAVNMKYDDYLMKQVKLLQRKMMEKIEFMTAFNVNRLDVEVKGIR